MISYNLYNWSFLLIIMKVVFSFVASFLAVFLWQRTRRAGQIFLVMALFATFAEAMYQVLLVFGFFSIEVPYLKGFPLFLFVFSLMPYLFFICSLIFFIKEK